MPEYIEEDDFFAEAHSQHQPHGVQCQACGVANELLMQDDLV